MFTIMAVFLPSLLALKIMDYLLGGLNLKNLILYYGILLLLSQSIGNMIVPSFLDIDKSLWNSLNAGTDFFSLYVLILIIINLLLAGIIVILIKNVKIEIEVEYVKNDKEDVKSYKKRFNNIKKLYKKNKDK